jgi:hypothetical protein|uniref:Uncharacterized protein n=1 Tax=Bacteriophage sp. TaxID=38018 RepID=A0A8D9PGP9_9VIRU|nr:MAG TPA: hypothetical protein [Bacteriophage sp.]
MKIRHKVLTKITKEDVRYFLIEHDELQEAIRKVGSTLVETLGCFFDTHFLNLGGNL